MKLQTTDFNGAETLIPKAFRDQWKELKIVLSGMPLHLKSSDQAGIQGNPIFDPVGTNEFIKGQLAGLARWNPNLLIPAAFKFLGTDVDFVSNGLLVEIQFSNYPFLLNNTVRAELFFKAGTPFTGNPIRAVIIVTKAKMFPASNSTLYYEQAVNQLTELARHRVFSVPMRLVGLFEEPDATVDCVYSEYSSSRYSRTVLERNTRRCRIRAGRSSKSRSVLRVLD